MSLQQSIQALQQELQGTNCQLIAVSKTKPVELLKEAYDLGIRAFGENKVQEMVDKQLVLPTDIAWHLIGHLQTNKVKYIVPFVHLIHSIDSLKLLAEVEKRAAQHGRVVNCLLQMHIAEEETKFGLSKEELFELLGSTDFSQMTHVCIKGLMGMATNTDSEAQIRKEFSGLKHLFEEARRTFVAPNISFTEISMGMSGDYRIAIEEGSTLIRVGSKLFGSR